MRACVMVEPQMGMTYDTLLRVGRSARQLGLEGLFRSDHYVPFMGTSPKPSTDAWATLAGLVRDLADGVVGTLVSPVTFRHPGQLAKVVATVAHMSAGPSVELGLGTGWHQGEHEAYGFTFGSFADRFAILEEYLPTVRRLLTDPPAGPAAPDVRIIVGGGGPRRTPLLAARFADELNMVFLRPEDVAARVQVCQEALPEGKPFTFSWMGGFLIGRTPAEVVERAGRLGQGPADAVLARMQGRGPVGTVSQAAEFLESLGEVGVTRVMLQHLLTDDDEHLALAAEAAAEAHVA